MNYNSLVKLFNGHKVDLARKRELEIQINELEVKAEGGLKAVTYDGISVSGGGISRKTENDALKAIGKNEEAIENIKREIGLLKNRILRVENLLSILSDDERQIIELKHISYYSWENVTFTAQKAYRTCKRREQEGFEKMLSIVGGQ
ncbi:MAG: hypothetical protein ACRC41_18075 [Sarcina sp.]